MTHTLISDSDYGELTARVALHAGGRVVGTGGGFIAARFAVDGAYAYIALDDALPVDGPGAWVVWREDADGESCCDWSGETIPDLSAYAAPEAIVADAMTAMIRHRHHTWPESPREGHCDSLMCANR